MPYRRFYNALLLDLIMVNETILSLTKRLISLETIEENISQNHAKVIEQILSENGYSIQKVLLDGVSHYLATIENDGPHLAFIGHYDVVPAGNGWKSNAFEPKEEDGKIFGRGASDMKGALAVQIVTGKKLAELGFYISIFVPGDEEKTNGRSMLPLLKLNKKKIDFVIGGEPTAEKVSGDVIKPGRRGALQGEVTINGIAGHSAYPQKADNPIHKFLKLGQDLIAEIDRGNGSMPATSFQITNINSGEGKYNVIPGEIKFKFDIRNSPATSLKEIEKILSERLSKIGKDFEIKISSRTEPFLTSNEKFLSLIKKGITAVIGHEPRISFEGGTSDCRFVAAYDPQIPIVEIGVPSEGIHGANEFVTIKNLEILEKIYLEVGKNLIKK